MPACGCNLHFDENRMRMYTTLHNRDVRYSDGNYVILDTHRPREEYYEISCFLVVNLCNLENILLEKNLYFTLAYMH